jgi:hypothetical protein
MKTFKLWSFLLGCSITMLLWYVVDTNRKEPTEPQREDRFIDIVKSIEDERVGRDENIFFIESNIGNFHQLDSHQACSIESAGKLHMSHHELI